MSATEQLFASAEDAGYTMRVFADLIGMTHVSLSRFETGKQGLSAVQLLTIADRLQIPLSEFSLSNTTEEHAVTERIMRDMAHNLHEIADIIHDFGDIFQRRALDLFALEWANSKVSRLRAEIEEVVRVLDEENFGRRLERLARKLEK